MNAGIPAFPITRESGLTYNYLINLKLAKSRNKRISHLQIENRRRFPSSLVKIDVIHSFNPDPKNPPLRAIGALDLLTPERLLLDVMRKPIVTCSPEVMGGTPVFAGTRVPVQTLIDYLEGGETIDDFLEGFPTVSREQVVAFLEEARDKMVAAAS